ncbi:alpha/beta hydrolase [Mesorhizobium sp. BE184]|uniref:alpha/beta fold hydrolase n=1 Tax=Mesorhizobium sp. BE184 TaxID=2817714 RepID=UPI002856ADC5|nr:alpha/beta hydrolase [Mesorhizobium sp. BE184]MDR7034185.1 pimeloyl-ACP methyl ester carboxylesterase [Mesorhizobium sp. BE184]
MNLVYAALAFLAAIVFVLVGTTRVGTWLIERRNPPIGAFADIDGARIHYVHVNGPANPDLPPVVFIHGASANLKDQMLPLRPLLEGRAEMLFFDRPGFGWSERGNNDNPSAQANTLAKLMDRLGIEKAIVVGHSFGGAVTAAFGVEHGDKTLGLVFAAAATHPWPGGATSWYYDVAKLPVIGRLFTETLTYPAGLFQLDAAMRCVFAPNNAPDNYGELASIPLVLRPAAFRANATDVAGLYDSVLALQPRYRDIKAPTVILSGDRDSVVYEELHSGGLARDIPGSELVWVRNLGHKPDWIAPDLVVASIEKLAGKDRDLEAVAQAVEARIAGDSFGRGRCADMPATDGELAPT